MRKHSSPDSRLVGHVQCARVARGLIPATRKPNHHEPGARCWRRGFEPGSRQAPPPLLLRRRLEDKEPLCLRHEALGDAPPALCAVPPEGRRLQGHLGPRASRARAAPWFLPDRRYKVWVACSILSQRDQINSTLIFTA